MEPCARVVVSQIYGERKDRHQEIMMMNSRALHEMFPFTATLKFNEVLTKGQFVEKNIPDESCIFGLATDGTQHRFCVGNEEGEILPKFLLGPQQSSPA